MGNYSTPVCCSRDEVDAFVKLPVEDAGTHLGEDVLVHHQQLTRLATRHGGRPPDIAQQRHLLAKHTVHVTAVVVGESNSDLAWHDGTVGYVG